MVKIISIMNKAIATGKKGEPASSRRKSKNSIRKTRVVVIKIINRNDIGRPPIYVS